MNRIQKIKNILINESEKNNADEKKQNFYHSVLGLTNDYAKHDKTICVSTPVIRKIAKEYHDLKLLELQNLIESEINEERLLALIILVNQYNKSKNLKNDIFTFYLNNTAHINNWNLVDSSAHYIIGAHFYDKLCLDYELLHKLAKSDSLWERRISIVSTWYFIRNKHYDLTIDIAKVLLNDQHHLIHKAVGLMLKEIGKKNEIILIQFLDKYSKMMPRLMLRSSIEKLNEKQRRNYMVV